MSKRLLLSSSLALATIALSAPAQAQHDLRAYLSESGLDFVAQEAPSYVPSVFQPPTFAKSFACMDFVQRDTTLHLSIESIDISMPSDGRIQVDLTFSASGQGELYADDIYACLGEVTCQDSLDIRTASASLDYEITVENGQARAAARNIDFQLAPEDVQFELTECGFTGTALTSAVDFAEEWILVFLQNKVSTLADEHLGPLLEGMLDGFSSEGSVGIAEYSAALQDLQLMGGGLGLRIDADLSDRFAAAECVQEFDEGGPGDIAGDAPDLAGPTSSHANMAVNLGLVNKGLYSAWRRGMMCLTDAHIRALGVELDLSSVGAMLPGFPAGTEIGLEFRLANPPRVKPNESSGSQLTMILGGIQVDLHGDRPDGSRNTLHVELDVEATATVGIDPFSNAIVAQIDNAAITRMEMEDERAATGEGYDVARIIQLVQDHILPKVLGEMGPMPLTGPTFSFEGYAVLLRQLSTNQAYLSAGIDFFKIPEDDSTPPDTQIVESPSALSNPHHAVVQVSGTDGEIPSELLQYQVTIDGDEQAPSFVRAFKVGEMGRSATYQVAVAAVDLNGNVDPSPAEVAIQIDGVTPVVSVAGARKRAADQGPVDISWTMSDDLSASESIHVTVEVYELEDPSDALSTRLIQSQQLGAGATSTTVELENIGGIYRVEIHAMDEAGNDSQSSLLLTIAGAGGCSIGDSSGAGHTGLWLLALTLLAFRRRQRRAR